MMSNYNVVIDNEYVNSCTVNNKRGMYPTFDVIEKYIDFKGLPSILPEQNSPIITLLREYFTMAQITNYYTEVCGYRNCCIPLSEQYPNLTYISSRIRIMWHNHDIANAEKFRRIISAMTAENEVSPIYNIHKKYTTGETITPNLTDTTTRTGTEGISKTNSESTTGSDGVSTVETGTDNTTNSTTSFDTYDFANDNNSRLSSTNNIDKTTSYGKTVSETGSDTKTYNTTFTDKHTGTSDKDGSGESWESNLSIAEIQQREIVMNTILDIYFTSVMSEISLYTMEDIY